MGRPIKRQFFDFNIPPTTLQDIGNKYLKKIKKKHWKERKKNNRG